MCLEGLKPHSAGAYLPADQTTAYPSVQRPFLTLPSSSEPSPFQLGKEGSCGLSFRLALGALNAETPPRTRGRSPALAPEPRLLCMPLVCKPGCEVINAPSPPACWAPSEAGDTPTVRFGHIRVNGHRDVGDRCSSQILCPMSPVSILCPPGLQSSSSFLLGSLDHPSPVIQV